MKKGLGRGFDSLIPTNLFDEAFDPTAGQDATMSQLRQLPTADIIPDPDQPRRFFDEEALRELADSIRRHGVVQPIVVTPRGAQFMIVAGERRWRAAQLAGLVEMPSIIRSLSDQHRLEVSLIENLQRRDLNPLETATAYMKLRDQFNMTLEQIGQHVGGKSVSAISNTLRLLKLPSVVRTALFENKISEGQARTLVGLPDDVAEDLLQQTIHQGWSVRKLEQMIAAWKRSQQPSGPASTPKPARSPHASSVARLSKKLRADITVRTSKRGAGQIIIPFKDQADFERIRDLIG
ncbi:ParB/RepB/Spo0J family partition protein [Candidatus Saccharibacteria bacterium oral taxon 488]|nr:ParB/RepB/Spo0J family partition protein [Candidatus Saccharibacteria bacterium oral taxon 488]